MRQIAIGLLLVVLLSILIEPLVEIANVMREKIIIGTALSNASRAAKDRSLVYESQRDLDAEIDEERFRDYFAEAFEDALNVTRTATTGDSMTFTSNDGKYHPFVVTLDIADVTEFGRQTSTVRVRAESRYAFKTKYLQMMDRAIGGADYEMVSERTLILAIRN